MDENEVRTENDLIKQTHSFKEAIDELRAVSKEAKSRLRIVYDIDVLNVLVVLICGVGLILSILYAKETMATTIGAGLLGYLSKGNKPQ